MKFFKIFFILGFCLFLPSDSFGLTLSHPEQQQLTVSEDGIFFSGKIKKYEKVLINNVLMHPEKTGAFSYSFPLKEGENIFTVQVKDRFFTTENIIYNIKRVSPKHEQDSNRFIPQNPQYYITTKDDVVLRSTPIDGGMNRLGYLPKDTKVFVDGTTNEFFRVYLSENNYGWLKKGAGAGVGVNINVGVNESEDENSIYHPVSVISTGQIKTEKDTTYTINLSENCPYSAVSDGEELNVTVYNVDDSDEVYTKVFPLEQFPRYTVMMRNGVLYVIMKKQPVTNKNYSNRKIKIVLDAGHGGKECGATGCLGDKEKNFNLEVAQKLKKILEEHQFDVTMTRESDKFVSLDDRINFAKDNNALIFLSIHMNSVPISSNPNLNRGSVVFYFNPQSKNLAKILSKNLSQTVGTVDGGATQASFAVIRPTEYIGVLAELAYLVNPKDVSIYKNKKFITNSANALYKGLMEYIHSELNQ